MASFPATAVIGSVVPFELAAGDTGVPLGKTSKVLLEWGTAQAPTSFILDSTSAQTGVSTEIQFW